MLCLAAASCRGWKAPEATFYDVTVLPERFHWPWPTPDRRQGLEARGFRGCRWQVGAGKTINLLANTSRDIVSILNEYLIITLSFFFFFFFLNRFLVQKEAL